MNNTVELFPSKPLLWEITYTPSGGRIKIKIIAAPTKAEAKAIFLQKNAQSWIGQIIPAVR